MQFQSWQNDEYNRQTRASKNNTRIKRNLLLVKEVVRGLDINDGEDWAADDVKVLQEDVEEQEHHARDANISMLYLIKDHDCNIYS